MTKKNNKKSMNILRVHATFQIELKYYEHYLAEVLKEKNVFTTFLTTDKLEKAYLPFLKNQDVVPGEFDFNGSKIIRLKAIEIFGKQFIIELRKMYEIITNSQYDILHLYGFGNPVGFLAIFISLFNKEGMYVVASDHSNPNMIKNTILAKAYYFINMLFYKILGKRIKRIYVPNIAGEELIRKRYKIKSPSLVRIIPLGFDKNTFEFNSIKKNSSSKLIIGFAGKIDKKKNLELLIDALSDWNISSYELFVVGLNQGKISGYQDQIMEYAKMKMVAATFLPIKKGDSELSEFYNFIDVAIFPGTISITTIEANGCGTPILLYNSIRGLEDRVENGRGELFSSKDELLSLIEMYYSFKKKNAIDNKEIEKQTSKYSFEEIGKIYLEDFLELKLTDTCKSVY